MPNLTRHESEIKRLTKSLEKVRLYSYATLCKCKHNLTKGKTTDECIYQKTLIDIEKEATESLNPTTKK